ncbi:MAG: putative transposase DNA-binding domain protein [Candidatus Bathyarchaeota archaeon BA1]|nr:MAG: putative transposase DNA-binding domain protein [Candidatus Bathyarchaeota archaeon BA1]
MIVRKTVKARIFALTRIKGALLREEYDNFQACLRGFDAPLYSATKQQAHRLLRKVRKQNGKGPKNKEYPMILRRDVFNIRKTENKLAKFWVKIPVHHVRGRIKVPIQLPRNQEHLLSLSIREGKLLWKGDHWSLHITVMKEVELRQTQPPSTILAVDLGERRIATSVVIADGVMKNPKFYGKKVRGIRRHYAWLRRRLGKRKLLRVIKRIGHREKRKVDAILHKISKGIVSEARRLNAVIIVGDLKGIRDKVKDKGGRMNRIVSHMPYYHLTQMITYKALWEGILVYKISEAWTSKTCHRCGREGERLSQARFKCTNCRLDHFNADLNGAINIAERFSSYIGESRAALDTAQTLE